MWFAAVTPDATGGYGIRPYGRRVACGGVGGAFYMLPRADASIGPYR